MPGTPDSERDILSYVSLVHPVPLPVRSNGLELPKHGIPPKVGGPA